MPVASFSCVIDFEVVAVVAVAAAAVEVDSATVASKLLESGASDCIDFLAHNCSSSKIYKLVDARKCSLLHSCIFQT